MQSGAPRDVLKKNHLKSISYVITPGRRFQRRSFDRVVPAKAGTHGRSLRSRASIRDDEEQFTVRKESDVVTSALRRIRFPH